jgi:hypothetical protein
MLVMADRVQGSGRAHPHPHQAGLILPLRWNVRQKMAIATLCVLCGNSWGGGGEEGNFVTFHLCITYYPKKPDKGWW